jgi:acetoacetyl-CoA reductase
VNNAGITRDGLFHKMSWENWRAVLATNLDSMFAMTRPVIEGMRARCAGRIINISSNAGRGGGIGSGVAYSASKAGVLGLTKSLARKYAQKNITVNAVAPGPTSSDIVKGYTPEEYQKISASIPVGRFGTPEEIAKAVAFLASESSGFITGATLDINGGIYIG